MYLPVMGTADWWSLSASLSELIGPADVLTSSLILTYELVRTLPVVSLSLGLHLALQY